MSHRIRISSIGLLMVYLLNFCGYIPLFAVLHQLTHSAIQDRIRSDESELDLIVIEDNGMLQWHEDDEFSVKGTYYDIVRCDTVDNRIVYYCLADSNDTMLAKSADRFNSQNDEPDYTLSSLNLLHLGAHSLNYRHCNVIASHKFNHSSQSLLCHYPESPTPPPESSLPC